MLALGRLITALVTPFTDDGTAVDTARLEHLIAHCLATGTDGLLVGGTTGEGPTLEQSEFLTLVSTAKAHAPDGVMVMANVGTNCTRTSVARAMAAEASGADALLVVCPYYNKPPQAGLLEHFATVAGATPLPVMIYNIPGRTAVNLLPATFATLIERCPTVVGIKEASGDLEQMSEVLRLIVTSGRSDVHLWSGDDGITAEVMRRGGVGVVSVVSQVAGVQLQRIMAAALRGDHAEAARLQQELEPLVQAAFRTTNPIGIKLMLNALGVPVGPVRLPLIDPAPAEVAAILAPLALAT